MFKLAEAFVEIKADTRGADAGIDGVKRKLDVFPWTRKVKLGLDASSFHRGLASAKESLASLGGLGGAGLAGALGGAVGQLAVGAAAGGAGAFRSAIAGAADLTEATNKLGVVFGSEGRQVEALADSMARAYGSSKLQIIDAASSIGLIAKAAGQAEDAASGLAVSLVKAADDASSLHNVELPEVLQAIRSGLVGESEPLRRFGVLLNEDAVKAEAFSLGIAKSGRELDEMAKVMSRASLIQKGLSVAQGDHARTSQEFQSQIRELSGRLHNMGVEAGQFALPALNGMLRVLNPIAKGVESVGSALATTTGLFGNFFAEAARAAGLGGQPSAAGLPSAVSAAPQSAAAGPGGGGLSKALEAARDAVAKEREHAEQQRLVQRVRGETEASGRSKELARQDAAVYRKEWVGAEAAKIEARLNANQKFFMASQGEIEYAKKHNAGLAEVFAARNFESARIARGGDLTAPSRQADRDKIAGALSAARDFIPQGLGLAAQAKQQGLGVLGKGLNFLEGGDGGEGLRKRAERDEAKRLSYRTEFLDGGSLSQRIQAAALAPRDKAGDKELLRVQTSALEELKNGFKGLTDTIRQGGSLAITYR